ncbi:anti-sigma factor family protein [Zavarzinia sp. CC-PAN008]|uniref:anti-sigma factor family protein n=1 Tax=Zavarzinia sp. CC-PAN008 TaxID=3243332 RepID=UPI003F749EE1
MSDRPRFPALEEITPFDLAAYVDEQLDPARRVEVEDHLSRHPQAAAEVMADLRTRDALRLSFPRPEAPASEHLLAAAHRLERGLGRALMVERLRRVAALALLVGAGWLAHGELGIGNSVASTATPAFLQDVARAHRAALVRAEAAPASAIAIDAVALKAATEVPVPQLPTAWRVRDVQVVDAHDGPALELTADDPDLGRVTLFGERVQAFSLVEPTPVETPHQSESSVYWQIGEVAYALTGRAPPVLLQQAAYSLSRATH